jgi:hypothetical protein
MEPLQANTSVLPPALRAIALSLLFETVLPLLNRPGGRPEDQGDGAGDSEDEVEVWQLLDRKCDELSALVLRANEPGEAARRVLRYLPKRFDYVFEQLFGGKRLPVLDGSAATAESWDSPLEPRRTNGSCGEGPGEPWVRLRQGWDRPTSPDPAPLPHPLAEFHPGS